MKFTSDKQYIELLSIISNIDNKFNYIPPLRQDAQFYHTDIYGDNIESPQFLLDAIYYPSNECRWIGAKDPRLEEFEFKDGNNRRFSQPSILIRDLDGSFLEYFNASIFKNVPVLQEKSPDWKDNQNPHFENIISSKGVPIYENIPTSLGPFFFKGDIHISPKHLYLSEKTYYLTVFHEYAHSSKYTLNRPPVKKENDFFYCREEAIAELSAVMLLDSQNMYDNNGESTLSSSLRYIQSYLNEPEYLKNKHDYYKGSVTESYMDIVSEANKVISLLNSPDDKLKSYNDIVGNKNKLK